MKKALALLASLFIATSAAFGAGFDVEWKDNSSKETGYVVERSTDGVNFTEIGTTVANATKLNDPTPEEGVRYYYRIKAVNASIESAYSAVNSAVYPLAAPSGTTITISISE